VYRAATYVTCVLAAASVFLLAGYRYEDATWLLGPEPIFIATTFSFLFLGLLILTRRWLTSGGFLKNTFTIALASALTGGTLLAAVVVMQVPFSGLAVIDETLLMFTLVLLNQKTVPPNASLAINTCAFLFTIYPSIVNGSVTDLFHYHRIPPDESINYILTSRHDVRVVDQAVFQPPSKVLGGGFARIDDRRILLASGDGRMVVLTSDEEGVDVLGTELRFPLAYSAYSAAVERPTPFFRVTGVLLDDAGSDPRRLYIAHHAWNEEDSCLTLNLSEAEWNPDQVHAELVSLEWISRYHTEHCIPASGLGNRSGGRLAFLDRTRILMTIGDHATKEVLDLDRDYAWEYGTIVLLRTDDWTARPFTTGHRNPQGLLVDGERVWSTEHGPQGGDELNLLVEGADYGWPRSTYGTEYGQRRWPLIEGDDPHGAGTKPVFAWVPSIAISNLIRIRGDTFPAWTGDLMLGSLPGLGNGNSIFRVKLDGLRVVMVERIYTKRSVRDLIEATDGKLILWDGSETIQIVEPATHVFSPCSGCHALRWRSHGIGPDLMGIVGERVAHHDDYQYSDALRSLGGRWTRTRLDSFLRDPRLFAPGTTMDFPGIADAAQRAAIIEYLDDLDGD